MSPFAFDSVVTLMEHSFSRLHSILPLSFIVTTISKRIFSISLSFSIHVISLVNFTSLKNKTAFSMKFTQFPFTIIALFIRVCHFSHTIALIIVKTAFIHLSICKMINSLSEFLPVHNLSLV